MNMDKPHIAFTEEQLKEFHSRMRQLQQRKMLGVLCALLAPLSLLFGLIGAEGNYEHWYYSISATFYANSNMFMIGLLFATAVFFLSYKGYDLFDNIITDLSAIFALGVLAFPCRVPGGPARAGIFYLPIEVSNVAHFVSAACLFVSFSVMIFFQFTQGNSDTPKKRKRNRIYRICGAGIFAVLLWHVATLLLGLPGYFTMIDEFVMLMLFSFAWLTKGEAFKRLND